MNARGKKEIRFFRFKQMGDVHIFKVRVKGHFILKKNINGFDTFYPNNEVITLTLREENFFRR